MGYWVVHSKDDVLPSWIKDNLPATCKYCGWEMENWYNDSIRCTNRRCTNPSCYGMMAAKGDFMMKVIGVKGIGFAKCLDALRGGKMTHHVQLLKILSEKPEISVQDFLRIHCFDGIDSEWEKICVKLNCYTVDDILKYNLGRWTDTLKENKELLDENLQYVTLKKRPVLRVKEAPSKYLTIMITGTPIGYASKEHFIDKLNAIMCGRIVLIHQKTKRKTGVDYLIREPGSATRGKVECALSGGIPIVTSAEFVHILLEMMNRINSEKGIKVETDKIKEERSESE